MLDVTGNTAIDVAIGLFSVFFVLSIVCSSITEAISASFKFRARDLERGVRNLLDESQGKTDEFFKNPRVKQLCRSTGKKPSYIPPRVFALAFLDTVAPPEAGSNLSLTLRAENAIKALPEDSVIRTVLHDATKSAETNVTKFRAELETSFDDVMDRASGWYKRRTQLVLLIVSIGVVGVANADALAIGQRLFKDDAVRAAVVAQAAKTTDQSTCPGVSESDPLKRATECVDRIERLGLPFAWSDTTTPDDAGGWLAKLGGLLLTIAALSLGAPFWFDLLGKVSRLRATGKREGTEKP